MIEKEFAVEFLFKEKMMLKSFVEIKKYLIKASKKKENKKNKFKLYSINNALYSIKNIKERDRFDYFDAFSLSIALSDEFLAVKKMILNGSLDLNKDIKREDYWRNEEIGFNEGVYFTITFLNETYKKQLNIDFKKLSEKIENASKLKNSQDIMVKIYLDKMKSIKKEEEHFS